MRMDRLTSKFQLALAYLGLNNGTQAKTYFRELYALDSDFFVDPQQYSPKVTTLADQAKAEQNELRCREVTATAERQLGSNNGDALMKTSTADTSATAAFRLAMSASRGPVFMYATSPTHAGWRKGQGSRRLAHSGNSSTSRALGKEPSPPNPLTR